MIGKGSGLGQVKAGGVGIRWVGGGADVGEVGSDFGSLGWWKTGNLTCFHSVK